MKTFKAYLTVFFSLVIFAGGVLLGMKMAKPEVKVTINKPKARRGGKVIVDTDIDAEQEQSVDKSKKKKRFRIRKKNRIKN